MYSADDNKNVLIEDILPPPKGKKLFYLFDYGDSWIFQISSTRQNIFLEEQNIDYPRCVNETGDKQKQYPNDEE